MLHPATKSSRIANIYGCLLTVAVLAAMGGCASSSRSVNHAPVEDRTGAKPTASAAATQPATTAPVATVPTVVPPAVAPVVKLIPGAENAGKPGYYTVKPGDTLIRIGLDTGQNWRDVARWSGVENPNIIEVGQVLRVIPPGTTIDPVTGVISRPVVPPAVVVVTTLPPQNTRTASASDSPAVVPVPGVSATSASSAPSSIGTAPAVVASASPAVAPPLPPASSPSDEDVGWIWPAAGTVVAGFDEVKNKGINIAGKLGDPVLAAGDGRVVYAGSGLRGYGNLVILKHNNTYLTAYAHNQALLVKEDQTVRKGQKIAEMGSSDTDRVKLHFEIRRQGKPIDPSRLLPAK